MRNFPIYLAVIACLILSKVSAQQTFEERAKMIAFKIENITKEEKSALKFEVEAVNNQLINGTITKDEADARKKKLAEAAAINIESKVAAAQEELKVLVQEQVDGKIKETDSTSRYTLHLNFPVRVTHGKHSKKTGQARTTSQFVFAAGVNNVLTDKKLAGSDFRYWGSHFYEWGVTYNTRIAKNSNLLHAKYGLSLMYNNLRPTDNRMFVDNGNQTDLETSTVNLKDSRFRNVNLVMPLHLEFDFTKPKIVDGKTIFRSHEGFRFGIGGYAGVNIKSKQVLRFNEAGYKSKDVTKGSFNVNDLVYGVSSYIGFGETSLYVKYDLSPLFKDNAVKQNNISMGVRFDLN